MKEETSEYNTREQFRIFLFCFENQAGPARTGPNRAGLQMKQNGPDWATPGRTEPDRARPSQTEPDRTYGMNEPLIARMRTILRQS